MTEGKEKKKKKSEPINDETLGIQPAGVGGLLRAARLQKGVGLEEISSAVHIRVGQLRAIEEGDLAALPGMTYAVGFVKSYAGYLKLDSAEIVRQFKAEHGAKPPASQQLHFPEPVAEGSQPNFLTIGIAGFCAVLLLVAWAIFSGGGEQGEKQQAEQIPVAPAVGTVTGITNSAPQAAPAPAPVQSDAASNTPNNLTNNVSNASTSPQPAGTVEQKGSAPAPVSLPEAPAVFPQKPVDKDASAAQAPVKDGAVQAADNPVIKIGRGKGRIVLGANQPSWVEIRGASGESVLKKVLRPGEKFYVPDKSGQTLLTSNAGGLDIYVDGAKVQALGRPGDIVRGVALNPDELKIKKIKARDNR